MLNSIQGGESPCAAGGAASKLKQARGEARTSTSSGAGAGTRTRSAGRSRWRPRARRRPQHATPPAFHGAREGVSRLIQYAPMFGKATWEQTSERTCSGLQSAHHRNAPRRVLLTRLLEWGCCSIAVPVGHGAPPASVTGRFRAIYKHVGVTAVQHAHSGGVHHSDRPGRWHSQSRQDEEVAAVLTETGAPLRNGYFIDLAANDPIFLSNTRALERDHGWRGLCIDGNTKLLQKLGAAHMHGRWCRRHVSIRHSVLFSRIQRPRHEPPHAVRHCK